MGVWRGMSVSARIQDAAYVFQFRSEGGRDPVRRGAAVHFLRTLAEGEVDLSLVSGDTVAHVLLCFFDECTEALGGVDEEGSILSQLKGER
jgi:hypothetical protein